MAYVITSDCISCGVCVDECPVKCIKEDGGTFVIVKEECIECGVCAAPGLCPVDAIKEQ